MRLAMYNMGFGECFLLSEQDEDLVIDLGSDLSSFNYAPIFADIKARGKGRSTSLLLTHFHRDHIGGVLDPRFVSDMPPIHKIYLPNLLAIPVSGHFDLLKSDILSEVLQGVLIKKGRHRLTLHELLLQIRSAHTQAFFLESRQSFSVGGRPYRVLWPHIRKANEIDRRMLSRFDAWFESFGGKDSELFQIIETYEMELVEEYRRLSEEGEDQTYERPSRTEELEAAIWSTAEAVISRMSSYEIASTSSLANALKYLGNRLSIVFEDGSVEDEETLPILMTGDVPKKILNDLLREPCRYGKYSVIKTPHHGTGSHFTCRLPPCETIAISNGDTNSPKRGMISYQYSTVYASSSNPAPVRLVCSDCRCELPTSFVSPRHCAAPCVCGTPTGCLYISII